MTFSQWYWRLFWLIVALTFAITIAYSRMFLGVHSLNQVIFGAMMGMWSAFTAHFYFKESLDKHIRHLIDATERVSNELWSLFNASFGLLLCSIIIQVITYEIMLNFENP